MTRLSWRKVQAGMRAYDPARGNPVILAIVPNIIDWKPERPRHPAWLATSCGWGLTPRAGFVKVVDEKWAPGSG